MAIEDKILKYLHIKENKTPNRDWWFNKLQSMKKDIKLEKNSKRKERLKKEFEETRNFMKGMGWMD